MKNYVFIPLSPSRFKTYYNYIWLDKLCCLERTKVRRPKLSFHCSTHAHDCGKGNHGDRNFK